MRSRLVLSTVLFLGMFSHAHSQLTFFVAGHVAAQSGSSVLREYQSEGIIGSIRENYVTRTHLGGGLGWGFGLSPKLIFMMNLDWTFGSGDFETLKDVPANTFIFDLGIRRSLFEFAKAQLYVQGSYGYANISMKTGEPTIYTGPGGGGYSSGINEIEGSHLSFGGSLVIAEIYEIQILGTRMSYEDAEAVTAVRMNFGIAWSILGFE
ncbi:MAG: hypothetical protein HYY49_04600 [Ignavibacteriales bacterium]|nr:hypothetical protein [Ignavibacteriales bacterium]